MVCKVIGITTIGITLWSFSSADFWDHVFIKVQTPKHADNVKEEWQNAGKKMSLHSDWLIIVTVQ